MASGQFPVLESWAKQGREQEEPTVAAKPRNDIDEFRDHLRDSFEKLAFKENLLVDVGVGSAVGLGQGVGGLLSLAGSGALDPYNVGVKIADYVLSKKPSDLVLPHHPADSPTGKRLRAAKDEFDKAFQFSTPAKFAEFVGEWVPALYGGAQSAGITRGMTMASAPKLLKEIGTSRLANRFSTKTAQALAELGDSVATDVARRAKLEVVGGIPFAERMMMAVGNSMGWGTFEAARTLGNTGDTEVAFKVGAAVGTFGAAGEMALVGLGKALFPSMRKGPIDLVKAWEEYQRLEPSVRDAVLAGDASALEMIHGKLTPTELKKGIDFLTKGERAISKLIDLEVLEQAPGFTKALKKMSPVEAKNVLQRIGQVYQEADSGGVVKNMLQKEYAELPRSQRAFLETPSELAKFAKRAKGRVAAVRKAERQMRTAVSSMDALDEAIVAPNLRRLMDDTPVSATQRIRELSKLDKMWDDLAAKQIGEHGRVSLMTDLQKFDVLVRKGMWGLYSDVLEYYVGRWGFSPSGMAKRMGIPALKFLELTEGAEAEIKGIRMKTWSALNGFSSEVAQLGRGNRALPHHVNGDVVTERGAHIAAIRDVYEGADKVGGGLAAVEDKFGPQIAELWKTNVIEPLTFFGQQLQKLGVNSMMDATELGALGVSDYFPHVVKSGPDWAKIEAKMTAALARQGKTATEIKKILNEGSWKRNGLRQFGTIDQHRKLVGTTQQKVGYGIPLEEDPLVALREHLDASTVRLSLGKRFGADGQLGSYYKAAIVDVGGSETEANMLVDTVLFESSPNRAAAKWARRVTTSQVVTKLTWAVIPNAFQTTITAIRFGPKSTLMGTGAALKDAVSNWRLAKVFNATLGSADKEIVANSLGFMEKSLLSGEIVFKGGKPQTLAEEVAEIYLKGIGFTMTERMNRMIAAHAGLAHSRELLQKMARGKLRGNAYTNAVRSLDSLGVDAVKVLDRFRASGVLRLESAELDQVMTQAVKQTQFATGMLDIPPAWRTPWGKVVMQFKTFAFSAGKTMRDQVWREFEQGNYRPFLYFMSLGGVSGEVIGNVVAAAQGRERDFPNGFARIVEDLSNFGGFGLAKSLVDAAMYGRTLESLLGPSVATVAGGVENVTRYGVDEGVRRSLMREPTYRAASRVLDVSMAAGGALLDGAVGSLESGWELMRREEDGGEGTKPTKMGSGMDELRERLKRLR